MTLQRIAASAVLLYGFACAANASLIGDTVNAQYSGSSGLIATPSSAVVGPTAEFTITDTLPAVPEDFVSVDVGDDLVIFSALTSAIFSGIPAFFELSDLDWVGQPGGVITGATLEFQTGMTNLSASDISFTADTLRVNFTDLQFASVGDGFNIRLSTQNAGSAPVPSSLALLGLAVAGMVSSTRRRARRG